ncbi:ABC transporter substrate-binding protein [Roseomonas fluvialis]|uniref:ABC transporter substrate-binding protein n=1 Tax=Roseomonas fluvialis TaxID=1750527 RepID=A0ABN6NZ49_9PROT|nr:ABC transporter substrate-binding protein [Roseomonas fluvialis]BDG71695.1 ABC transporter substrate-binding protein [Roseomonas fluvialis]
MNRALRLLLNHEHTSLHPNTYEADSSAATVILKLACPSLLRFDHDMRLQPDLAEAWEASPDQRRFTFRLRPGLTFHNGRVLDAAAAAACLRRMLDPRNITPQHADYEGLSAIDVLDARTLAIGFDEPATDFLASLAWRTYIVDDCAVQPVGAGPYEVTAWQHGHAVHLRKFRGHYAADRYAVPAIEIRWAPHPEQRIAAIEAGTADIVETVPQKAAPNLVARGLIETRGVHSPRKTVIAFRASAPPFDDVRVRCAVALAVDRDAIRERFLGGHGRALNGLLPADDPFGIDLPAWPLDREGARALLRDAGHGGGLRLRVAHTAMPPVPGVAAQVAADLAEVGITLDLRGYEDPPWWPAVYLRGDWQMAFQGASARPHPHIMFRRDLHTGGAFNPGGYANPALDALVAQARRCLDPEAQRDLYARAQRLVHEDVAVLPLYAADVLSGVRPGLRGFAAHPLGYIELAGVTLDAG